MVKLPTLPSFNLSYKTRDQINLLSSRINGRNESISKNQAATILKQAIITSLKQICISEQLKFIQRCVSNNLSTKRIQSSTNALDLRPRQRHMLQQTLMRNIRSKLFKDKSGKERNVRVTLKPSPCYTSMRFDYSMLHWTRRNLTVDTAQYNTPNGSSG